MINKTTKLILKIFFCLWLFALIQSIIIIKQENKQIFMLFSIIFDILQKVNIEATILYLGTDFLNVNSQNVSTFSAHILFLSSKICLLFKKARIHKFLKGVYYA